MEGFSFIWEYIRNTAHILPNWRDIRTNADINELYKIKFSHLNSKIMEIRKAKLKDITQIADFAVSLLKYHHDIDSYFAPAKDVKDVYRKFFKRCIYSKNRYLLVAEEDNKVIGYALGELGSRPPVFKIRKIGFISDMFVDKNFRKSGIAKQFLAKLFIWFKSKKLKYIELTVHVKNEIGNKAWAKYGFEDYMKKQRVELGKFNII